jgi:hypothetical protein
MIVVIFASQSEIVVNTAGHSEFFSSVNARHPKAKE